MRLSAALAAGLFCLSVMAGSAWAQVTASSATDPLGGIDFRLSGLMQTEHDATEALGFDQLRRLGSSFSSDNGPVLPTGAELDARPEARGGAQWTCLTEALYFEARGESVAGQFAVAEVILNRVTDPRYPDTICGVVNEGTGRRFACQFTYTCDGRPEAVDDPRMWQRMGQIARHDARRAGLQPDAGCHALPCQLGRSAMGAGLSTDRRDRCAYLLPPPALKTSLLALRRRRAGFSPGP